MLISAYGQYTAAVMRYSEIDFAHRAQCRLASEDDPLPAGLVIQMISATPSGAVYRVYNQSPFCSL